MYCMKCGVSVPAAARFCPGCGSAAADGGTAAGAEIKQGHTRRLLGIFGGIIVLGLIAAAALIVARRQPPVEQTAIFPVIAPPEKPPGETPAKLTPDVVAGFDWSGLTAEQLLAARAALDEAIAKEEQGTAKNKSVP